MICFGYIYFDWYQARWVLRSIYDKHLHKFISWFVLPLLGDVEDPEELKRFFDHLDNSKFVKEVLKIC